MTFRKLIFLFSLLIIIAALIYKIGTELIGNKNMGYPNINDIKILGLNDQSAPQTALSIRVITANLVAEFEAVPQTIQPTTPVGTGRDLSLQTTPSPSASNPLEISENPSIASASPTLTPTSPPLRIKSLRILGDLQNNGIETARSATPLITFYDAQNKKISVKVANFSEGYTFAEIAPNQKYFYDILIKDLPTGFQNLTVAFKASSSAKQNSGNAGLPISSVLKIQDRDIEENVATSSAGQNFHYYRLKGKMVNTGRDPQKNTRVIVVAKDADDRVFAWASQEFPSDLFSKNQKAQINILITPIKEEIAENFDVYLFGEKL